MGQRRSRKLATALKQLQAALLFYDHEAPAGGVAFLAVAKAFEVAVEYAWKEIKIRVEDEGLEALSPKDAIRQAAKSRLIGNAEAWLDYINARNNGVHDYFGMSETAYVTLARHLLRDARPLVKPSSAG